MGTKGGIIIYVPGGAIFLENLGGQTFYLEILVGVKLFSEEILARGRTFSHENALKLLRTVQNYTIK